jgi:hypothetical protein
MDRLLVQSRFFHRKGQQMRINQFLLFHLFKLPHFA